MLGMKLDGRCSEIHHRTSLKGNLYAAEFEENQKLKKGHNYFFVLELKRSLSSEHAAEEGAAL